MTHLALRLSLALVAILAGGAARAEPAATTLATEQIGAAVRPIYWGTGFFVDRNGHVLTAGHVVAACRRVEIIGNGRRIAATVEASEPELDLALLRADRSFGPPAAFDRRQRVPGGAMVTVLGYGPLSEALRQPSPPSRAGFNGMVLEGRGTQQISLVSDANPGASGSPVVGADGLVLGVLKSKVMRSGVGHGQPSEIRLAVSSSAAQDFLRAHGVTPQEPDDPDRARLVSLRGLGETEIKVECHL